MSGEERQRWMAVRDERAGREKRGGACVSNFENSDANLSGEEETTGPRRSGGHVFALFRFGHAPNNAYTTRVGLGSDIPTLGQSTIMTFDNKTSRRSLTTPVKQIDQDEWTQGARLARRSKMFISSSRAPALQSRAPVGCHQWADGCFSLLTLNDHLARLPAVPHTSLPFYAHLAAPSRTAHLKYRLTPLISHQPGLPLGEADPRSSKVDLWETAGLAVGYQRPRRGQVEQNPV